MYLGTHKSLYLSFRSKSSKIYRCWIVWGKNIRVVIIPSFLAIAYLGESESIYLQSHLINLLPLVTWIAPDGAISQMSLDAWGNTVTITSFVLTMVVNTLVTGLIVFKIVKVFMGVKPTSVEQTLGLTGGTTLRHIVFVVIESGMALLVIQLVRVVLGNLPSGVTNATNTTIAFYLVIGTSQMFNVIIRSAYFYLFFIFTDNI